jgi:hypothetical protein
VADDVDAIQDRRQRHEDAYPQELQRMRVYTHPERPAGVLGRGLNQGANPSWIHMDGFPHHTAKEMTNAKQEHDA